MKAIEVVWFAEGNMLVIRCECGLHFWQRLDRWKAKCPSCGNRGSTEKLRNELAGFLTTKKQCLSYVT